MMPNNSTSTKDKTNLIDDVHSVFQNGGWIQPSISEQFVEISENLTDGIYVATSPATGFTSPLRPDSSIESALDQMALDLDIQRELQAINAEFADTESDGLTD
jgi:hypothetical protein